MRQTWRLFLLMEVPAAAQYLDAPQQETPSLLITDHPAHPHPAFGGLRLVLDFGELLRVGWRRSLAPSTNNALMDKHGGRIVKTTGTASCLSFYRCGGARKRMDKLGS